MQVLDTSDPNAVFTSWNAGTVTASRRGVELTYVKTTVGSPTYDTSGLPASLLPAVLPASTGFQSLVQPRINDSVLATVLTYKACRLGSTKTFVMTVLPGAFDTNGILKFAEFLPICL